jgi:hypothetical protein
MIPTIQVTHAIYQELFKLARLDEDRDMKNQTVVISLLQNNRAKTATPFSFLFISRCAYKAPLL